MPFSETHPGAGLFSAPGPIPPVPSATVLGIRFHSLSMEDAIDHLSSLVGSGRARQVSFANAQTVSAAWMDRSIRDVINASDLTFPDGMSIVWGGRLLGLSIPKRIPGPDATDALCARAAARGWRIFLLGTSDENLARLSESLRAKHPGLIVAGTYSPPIAAAFTAGESDRMIDAVNDAKTDILFVGLSCPKQERWIAANINRLNVSLCLGVGAAFDFLSGRIPRAPEWFQNHGCEWVHRLWCEPKRLWKRYLLGNAIFLGLLWTEKIRRRLGHK